MVRLGNSVIAPSADRSPPVRAEYRLAPGVAAGIEKSPAEASPFAFTEPVVIQKPLPPLITATNIPRRLTRSAHTACYRIPQREDQASHPFVLQDRARMLF